MLEEWKLFDLYNCEQIFQFECPRQWEQLRETTEPGVRFCDTCRKPVYYCNTPKEFVLQGELGRCVAISKEVTIKRELESEREVTYLLGLVDVKPFFEETKKAFWAEVLELGPNLPHEKATLYEAKEQIEAYKQEEIAAAKRKVEFAAERAAWEEAEQARQKRQIKVRAELAKIEAMSNREAYGLVGNCPQCGFSHRWDGVRCSHCGQSPSV